MRIVLLIFTLIVGLYSGFSASAKELETGSPAASGPDWLREDRLQWDAHSRTMTPPELKTWLASAPNSFVTAALYNTQNYRPDEYQDIRQRHSYYDLISFVIEHDDKTPQPVRSVKFFHATTSVTIQAELGMVESAIANKVADASPELAKKWGITVETLTFLRDVNQMLFRKNMRVVHDLLFEWRAPRDPRAIAPKDVLTTFDFDIAMVDFEQTSIFDYIVSEAVPTATVSNINKIVSNGVPILGVMAQVRPWLKKAGFSKDDFTDYRWRVAVGRALVFFFYKKTESDYVAYMKSNPPPAKVRNKIYGAIRAPERIEESIRGNFTILGSWKTEQGARRHLAELRRSNLGLDIVIFPPYGRNKYWTVNAASYVGILTAQELKRAARSTGVARDAFVLARNAVDPGGKPFSVSPSFSELNAIPDLLNAASATITPIDASNVVTLYRSVSESEATARMDALKRSFPDLKLDLLKIPSDGTVAVAIATFASGAELDRAKALANHLGIPSGDIIVQTIRDPANLQRVADPGRIQSTWSIINSCYSSGKVTVESLHACSGYWLTQSTLTRCVLESDCRVLDDRQLANAEQISTFLKSQSLDLGTKLKVVSTAIPISEDAKVLVDQIVQCRNRAQSDNAAFVTCMYEAGGSKVGKEALQCASNNSKPEDILACVAQSSATPALTAAKECLTGDHNDPIEAAKCFAGPEKAQEIAKLQDCLESARSENNALAGCANALLPQEAKAKVECLTKAGPTSLSTVSCVLPDSGDGRRLVKALDCADRAGASPAATAACVAPVLGGDVGKAAECIARNLSGDELVLCMLSDRPELQSAQRVYKCISQGAGAASLIANCTQGILDDRTREVAGCVADNSSDTSAIAGCVAGSVLPKELGPVVKCASSSSGGTDFALCMAGPLMNEEWRIAAECAVESGGVAPAFAACTAGRLTLRELGKCLSGEIGTEGGCFGPNNTIVVAFKTVTNDLGNCLNGGPCLGKNNDIVKAAEAVGKVFTDLGDGAKGVWDDLFGKDSDWCRGDLTGWTCGA